MTALLLAALRTELGRRSTSTRYWKSFLRLLTAIGEGVSGHGTRREHSAQLAPGGDPELREHPVQVRADRAMREVQPLADFAVRQALRGELSDLQLLRGGLVACRGDAAPAPFARRASGRAVSKGEWLFTWLLRGVNIFEKTRLPVGTPGFEPATP